MKLSYRRFFRYACIFSLSILIRWLFLCIAFCLQQEDGLSTLSGYLLSYLQQAGDAPHYLQIAASGYQSAGDMANNVVFYPLYPYLIRFLSTLTGSLPVSGIIISNLSLGLASIVLYELFSELCSGNHHTALYCLLLFLCYPYGMFLTGIYTQSLFILCSSLCLLMLYRRHWLLAGAAGFLASLCRAQGVILLLPVCYEWLLDLSSHQHKHMLRHLLYALLIPAGTAIFLLINHLVAGDSFAFIQYEAQAPWYNTMQWIGQNLTDHVGMALEHPELSLIIYWVQLLLYFIGVFALFAGIYNKERTSFLAYGGAYIFVSYLHGWLISGPRYMLACLPLFLMAGKLKPLLRIILLVMSSFLAIAYAAIYLAGGAIM